MPQLLSHQYTEYFPKHPHQDVFWQSRHKLLCGFGAGTTMQAIFTQSLSSGGLMNPNQQHSGCCCGVFYAISKESSLCSQSNFGHLTPPERAGHRSMFSPFVVKDSHCGSLESQSVTTISRLRVFWSTSFCQEGPFKVMS